MDFPWNSKAGQITVSRDGTGSSEGSAKTKPEEKAGWEENVGQREGAVAMVTQGGSKNQVVQALLLQPAPRSSSASSFSSVKRTHPRHLPRSLL